eukprot:CAMPEP_0201553634 /NCGR_PEP_ID=MMETSP0173_2-20130828/31719_1 /ASSEMBLY_ACC=CAM_ASM_000268 /TAXON_ID=218659 /ORGANISM="Vexillifera sp., Strain DIVA3 564/2" /LENGTH=102 /DNA_ID=CAMNT_0047964549 /DNA_START=256 /DNA_END=561 /DNA_ORIENTATION=-
MKAKRTQEMQVPQQRLWNEICNNLQNHINTHARKRFAVQLPSFSVLSPQATSDTNSKDVNSVDSIVFSCEHFFSKREFFNKVLPEFKRKTENHPQKQLLYQI